MSEHETPLCWIESVVALVGIPASTLQANHNYVVALEFRHHPQNLKDPDNVCQRTKEDKYE